MSGYQNSTIGTLLSRLASEYPTQMALVYPKRELAWSFSELDTRATNLAVALFESGIRPGQRVAVWGAGSPNWVTTQFAVAKLGCVLVPINPLFEKPELEFVLQHSEASALVAATHYKTRDFLPILESLSSFGLLVFSLDFERSERAPFLSVEKLSEKPNESNLSWLEPDLDDWALLSYTSGTTGFPKGVMLSHRNVVNNASLLMSGLGFSRSDRLCSQFPLFHCAGCVMSVLGAFSRAATLIPVEVFDPLVTLELVESQACTAIFGVPSMFTAVLEHPQFESFDLSSLRTGTIGGAICTSELLEGIKDRMGVSEMTISYGLTETSPIVTLTERKRATKEEFETVGSPLPQTEIRVVCPETRRVLRNGEEGEIAIRGPQVMLGYYRDPSATDAVIDSEGWLYSGDLGKLCANGSLRVTGRIKDLIIRGGENISPLEIERIIQQHPAVLEVYAFGLPHARLQEVVACAVRLKSGETLGLPEIQEFCKGRLAPYKIPQSLKVVDSFPTTASGKVQRRKLK